MARELLLGIDAGGTVVKAVAFDLTGHAVAAGSASHPAETPRPGWVERDLRAVWSTAADAIRQCVAGLRPADRVVAVGIAGHNDGAYLLDDAMHPVRPAILASDTRAEAVLDRWRSTGVADAALPLIGQHPFAATPVTLLAWLAENEPTALDRTRHFLFCKDWIRLKLTGEVATDPTEASASFTSVESALAGRVAYDERVLTLFGLQRMAAALPPILASAAVAGSVTAAGCAETALPQGIPVVCGAHDVDAAAVGVGAITPGALSVVAGTFSINQIVSTELHTDARWQARAFLEPASLLNMSTSPASASTLEWFVRRLCPGSGFDFVDAEACAAYRGDSDLVFLPYLNGSPLLPHASGGFLGLAGWHTRGHLLRALLEGIACNHRMHVEALESAFPPAAVARATGGGMRSLVLRQLLADALGRPIEVADTEESGARGAAVLAGVGTGRYADLAEGVAATVRVAASVEPARPADFDRLYARFLASIEAMRPLWRA